MKRLKIYKKYNYEKGANINIPFSKSISNRALILSYLTNTNFNKNILSEADDTKLLVKSLNDIEKYKQQTEKESSLSLSLQNAGTTYRFLTSYLCLQKGSYILNCSERMKKRPISPLVEALKTFGAKIFYLEKKGYPPIKIHESEIESPKEILRIDNSSSSQFISSILMVSAFLGKEVQIKIEGDKYSFPYIQMTLDLMNNFGIRTESQDDLIRVFPFVKEDKTVVEIEKDWSSAAFLYQFVAMNTKSEVFIEGLKLPSIQGDSKLVEIFKDLGVNSFTEESGILLKQNTANKKNISINFKDAPDLAIPVIFACAKLKVIGRFSGLKNLRIKESNRLAAIEEILALFNYDFRMINDDEAVLINSCRAIETPEENREIFIDTKDDHRLFMSSALMSTQKTKVVLNHINTFEKSFPDFLKEIEKLGFAF